MININSEINNIGQLDFTRQNTAEAVSVVAKNVQKESDDTATKVTLSDSVKTSVNNIISKEDLAVQKLNIAKTIYSSLGDVRLELSALMKELTNTDANHNIESLTNLDNKSNSFC